MTPQENPQAAGERVDQMIALTERLTALVAEQAKAFEGRRPQDAARHIDEVGKLANAFRHESARIRAAPGLIAAASHAQRMRLRRATEAFDAVLARQQRAVAAAKTVTEGLMRAIAEEVASQRQRGTTYGASGTTSAVSSAATAITLNQRA